MDNVNRIAARLRRLVKEARAAGVVLVADAETMAVCVMSAEDFSRAEDLRDLGIAVDVAGGCGGSGQSGGGEYGIHGLSSPRPGRARRDA